MPGKESEPSRNNAGGSTKAATEPEVAAFEWDTSRESPQVPKQNLSLLLA